MLRRVALDPEAASTLGVPTEGTQSSRYVDRDAVQAALLRVDHAFPEAELNALLPRLKRPSDAPPPPPAQRAGVGGTAAVAPKGPALAGLQEGPFRGRYIYVTNGALHAGLQEGSFVGVTYVTLHTLYTLRGPLHTLHTLRS